MLLWNHTDFMYPTSSTTFRSDYDQLRCYSDCLFLWVSVLWTHVFGIIQWFLALTCAVMVVLAFLGLREQRVLPLNDKLLHFLCFMIVTGVSYFIVDIEEYVLLRVSIWSAVLTMVSLARLFHVYLLPGMRGEYGSGDISTSSSRLSFAAFVVGFWVRLCNHYSRYVDITFPEPLKLFSFNKN